MAYKPVLLRKVVWERIIWPSSMPYWCFWVAVPLMIFGSSLVVYYIKGEIVYYTTGVCLAFCTFMVPTYTIYASRRIADALNPLADSLWGDEQLFNQWFDLEYKHIFLLRSNAGLLTVIITPILIYATALVLRLPFRTTIANLTGLISILPLAIAGSHACFIIIQLMVLLRKVALRTIIAPLGTNLYVESSRLYDLCLSAGTATTIAYAALTIGAWKSPFGLPPIMLLWLSIFAFFPSGIFFWSTIQIRNLMRSAKLAQIKSANALAKAVATEADTIRAAEYIEKLESISKIQERIQNQKEWPVDLYTLAPFGAAVATAGTQIMLGFEKIKGLLSSY